MLILLCSLGNVHAYDYNDSEMQQREPRTLQTVTTTNTDVSLKPQMRSEPLDGAKYVLQTADMIQYLDNIIVFDSIDAYEAQPRILGFASDSTFGSAGDIAYATGILAGENISAYTLLKVGQDYKNPATGEFLGVQALITGEADVQNYDVPQTLKITRAKEHIEIGARLIQRTGLDLPATIEAKPARKGIEGYIISVKNPKTGVGKYSTLAVGLGSRNGLQVGDLLELKERPKELKDTKLGKKYTTKTTSFGEVLIYKVMEKVSLGIILSTEHPVVVKDIVFSPG